MVDSYKDEFNKKDGKKRWYYKSSRLSVSHFNHQSLCSLRSVALIPTVFNMAENLKFYPIKQQKKSLVAKFW